MRQLLYILIFISLYSLHIYGNDAFDKQLNKNRTMLENQKKENLKDRETITKKLDSFLEKINFRIQGQKEKMPPLAAPLKPSLIQDIEDTSHDHSAHINHEPLYAYINSSGVNMRRAGSLQSQITGTLNLNEEVELLAKGDNEDTIDGYSSPWILLKRKDRATGWVFGKYLSSNPATSQKNNNKPDKNSFLSLPAQGNVTSSFGYRTDPVTREKGAFHSGIDIAAPRGSDVYASADGKIIQAGYHRGGYGNLVIIQHSDDLRTYYGHLAKITVVKGQTISRGMVLGTVGSSGKTTGPHLHFEVRKGDKAIDPDAYLH